MFVPAEYSGWVEILRRGLQFLDLGHVKRNLRLCRLESTSTVLLADRQDPDSILQVFRGQQRSDGRADMTRA